ncbi:hypothetical protein [Actinophytocola sediminis]
MSKKPWPRILRVLLFCPDLLQEFGDVAVRRRDQSRVRGLDGADALRDGDVVFHGVTHVVVEHLVVLCGRACPVVEQAVLDIKDAAARLGVHGIADIAEFVDQVLGIRRTTGVELVDLGFEGVHLGLRDETCWSLSGQEPVCDLTEQ